jgi:uncharacterized protein with ATP-grasp and redox domains
MLQRPPTIRTDHTNIFAHNTMKVRVPRIIREVQELNPDYPTNIMRALDALRESLENDAPIPMIDLPAPDYDDWLPNYQAHEGHTWLGTDWFFAEIFFYRHLIQAVRWWENERDPFAPKKAEEMASEALWTLVNQALSIEEELSLEKRLIMLLHSALWGNRIDLSFPASIAHGHNVVDDDLLVDDSVSAVSQLLQARGTVHLIADNTGSELAMDLVLIDTLLANVAERVILHVKIHPTFVSDAIARDVHMLVEALASGNHGEPARRLGERLNDALSEGRLRLAPDAFWNSSYLLWEMPLRLTQVFQNAPLVIVKGDANYRRTVGDALWPTDTPFAAVTDYFPAPLLALRTLKSDTIVGLPTGMDAQLDGIDPLWRVNGRRGVIQFKP